MTHFSLRGEGRKNLIRQIAFERADFEREYAGRPIADFTDESIARAAIRYLGPDKYPHGIALSTRFKNECRKAVPRMHRLIESANEP